MTNDTKCIAGNWRYRRYAYLQRSNPARFGKFGLLEATSYANAKQWLGAGFRIKTVWLSQDEQTNEGDKDRVWDIVRLTFAITPTDS